MNPRQTLMCPGTVETSEAPKWTHRVKGDVDGFPRTSGPSEVDSSMLLANWITKGKLIGRPVVLPRGDSSYEWTW